MSIRKEDFISAHPRLYHITLARSLEDIHRHGLLSTSAILDKFQVTGERRHLLETRRRPKLELLSHPEHGEIALNDQIPLYEGGLRKCLTDMTIEEWCRNLNGRVFFWPDKPKPKGFRDSKLGKTYVRLMISADTSAFLDLYENVVEFSSINAGNARRRAAPRGRGTFAGLNSYPYKFVYEVTVPYSVTNTHLFREENLNA